MIAELDGTSPAYIRELLRRAALVAAEAGDGTLRVGDRELRDALEELRRGGGEMTQRLLGARAAMALEEPWNDPDHPEARPE